MRCSLMPLFGKEGLGEIFSNLRLNRHRELPIDCEINSHTNIKSPLITFQWGKQLHRRGKLTRTFQTRTLIRNYAIAQLGRVCYEPFI